MEYVAPLGLPRKAIALLGRLLDTLKPTSGHSPNPRVGIWNAPGWMDTRIGECSMKPEVRFGYREEAAEVLYA
jgi:hypothetical protein